MSRCKNMMCSWREPWKPFGFSDHIIDGENITLCANCAVIWLSDKRGQGAVTLGTPENHRTVYRKDVAA